MKLYKDGQSKDVQPKHVAREEAKGWSRTPPKPPLPSGWGSVPDEPSGDVSETEGDS